MWKTTKLTEYIPQLGEIEFTINHPNPDDDVSDFDEFELKIGETVWLCDQKDLANFIKILNAGKKLHKEILNNG